MNFLSADLYGRIEASMPIACVDFVPVRDGRLGLIRRASPHGEVWCHLGGRVLRGETLADALRRHCTETIGLVPVVGVDPQPAYVYQWFPPGLAPVDGTAFGDDPRKHAIGLSFVVEVAGVARPRGEALAFEYFSPDLLPQPLWPGCRDLFVRMGVIPNPGGV